MPPRAGGKLYFVRGRALRVTSGAPVSWLFDLTPEEERLGLGGLMKKYIFDALPELGDVTAPGWPGVRAGAEAAAGAGQDDDADTLIPLCCLHRLADFPLHERRPRRSPAAVTSPSTGSAGCYRG